MAGNQQARSPEVGLMNAGVLLVRADANSQIGSGHFMRCFALAQAWREQGGTAVFLMAPDSTGLEKRLDDEGIRALRLSSPPGSMDDADETSAVALQEQADWVALDGYHFSAEYQRQLQKNIPWLLAFDDLANAECYYADLLLNQNAYATPDMYGNRARNCRLLSGAAYFLLRREFKRRDRQRLIPDQAEKLLITFGGGDPENATANVLQALTQLSTPTMSVRVLVGAANMRRAELEPLAANSPHRVEFLSDSMQMADEMAWADLAISGAGSTSWELAFMGLPSLLITLSENQNGCASYLERCGISTSLGWLDQLRPPTIAASLQELSADRAKRIDMSSRGQRLIDGQGAERIIQTMMNLAGEKRPQHPSRIQ